MQIYTTSRELKKALRIINENQTIGFVPTMGALHEGHLSLVKNAKNITDKVIVSIFVNPTQFDKKEDLINYPSTLQKDKELLLNEQCDILFVPTVKEMYEERIEAKNYNFEGLEKVMEGAHRKGHFDGVGTIVKRLFEIVRPDFAFFGEKDFQQLQIIRKLVEKEHLKIKIIGCPIYREDDGLAMSSRNTRLSKKYRKEAPFIYQTLLKAKKLFGTNNAIETVNWVEEIFKKHKILRLEYFTIADEETLLPFNKNETHKTAKLNPDKKYRAFIAVFAGDIRLIDNIALF